MRELSDDDASDVVEIIATIKPSTAKSNALLYVDTNIAPTEKPESSFSCKALVDSGCSKTVLCYNAISASKVQNEFNIRMPEKPIQMASALADFGAVVLGRVDIIITFPAAETDVSITTTAYVVSGLSHKCFLGNDLIATRIIRSISPDAIFLSTPKAPYSKTDPTANCIMVPIYSEKMKTSETLLSAEMRLLDPGLNWVKAKLPKNSESTAFSVHCSTLEIEFTAQDEIFVPVVNASEQPTYLDCDDTIPHWEIGEADVSNNDDGPFLLSFHDAPLHIPEENLPESFRLVQSLSASDEFPTGEGEKPKTDKEMLDSVKVGHLPEDAQKLFRSLISKNLDVFSRTSTDIGCTHMFEGFANVKPGLNPIDFRTKYIPIAQSRQQQVLTLLQQLLDAAIIRQTTEPVPCLANIHVRVKPNGKLRLCLDSRAANYYTERLAAITTYTLDEMISKFRGRIVSMIDVSQSFFQLPLKESSKKHFAFQGPDRKIYELNRVSQGHHNSPLFLAHAMNTILTIPTVSDRPDFTPHFPDKEKKKEKPFGPMRTALTEEGELTDQSAVAAVQDDQSPITLFSIYDDLAITSVNEGEYDLHAKALQTLFNKMRKGRMKLRLEKLQLAPKTLRLLGMDFDSKYLIIPPSRFTAWWKMPVNTAARIKSFVQSAAYFRSFCPSFSHLTREMLKASNSTDFKPSEEMEEAKAKLLRTMEKHCKRRTVAPGDHLIVSTDASKYDCGATLEVVDEIEGRTELVSSYSRLFQSHEVNHDIFAKEVAAMVGALNHFSYYLRGCKNITIRTDVRGLLYIKATSSKNQTSFRLSSELSKYDPTIIHVPTNAHAIADTISRGRVDKEKMDMEAVGMTPAEADTLMRKIFIEHGRKFTKAEALQLITDEACKTIIKTKADRYGLKPPSLEPEKMPKKNIVRPNFVFNNPSNTGSGWKEKRPRKPTFATNSLTAIEEVEDEIWAEPHVDYVYSDENGPEYDSNTSDENEPENDNTVTEDSNRTDQDGSDDKQIIPDTPPIQIPNPEPDTAIRHVETQTDVLCDENLRTMPMVSLPLLKAAENAIRKGAMEIKDFIALQQTDPELQSMQQQKRFVLHQNKQGLTLKEDKIYLPKSLVRHAVQASHLFGRNIHAPKSVTYRKLSATFWRPNLQKEVAQIYRECFVCAAASPISMKKPQISESFTATAPRQAWYIDVMDITDPVAKACQCPRYAIVACDAYSNYIVLAPITDRNKKTICEALIYVILAPFGRPVAIISDNESGITSDYTQSMLSANNIRCHLISPKSPWANKAERAIRTVKQTLSATLLLKSSYIELLPTIMDLVNATPRPPTAVSASQLFFFSEYRPIRDGAILDLPPASDKKVKSEIQRAHERLTRERAKKRAHVNRARTERKYEPGEYVFLREPTIQAGSKLLAPAGELHIVREKVEGNAYMLEKLNTKEPIKRHAAHIFPAQLNERVELLSPSWSKLLEQQFVHNAADELRRVQAADETE